MKKKKKELEPVPPPPYEVLIPAWCGAHAWTIRVWIAAASTCRRKVMVCRRCTCIATGSGCSCHAPLDGANTLQGESTRRRAQWMLTAGALGAVIGALFGAFIGWTVALSDTRVRRIADDCPISSRRPRRSARVACVKTCVSARCPAPDELCPPFLQSYLANWEHHVAASGAGRLEAASLTATRPLLTVH